MTVEPDGHLLRVYDSGYLMLSKRIQERYGIESDQTLCQSVGTHLHVIAPTDGGAVIFRFPLTEWDQSDVYPRVMNENRVHIGRWVERMEMVVDNEEARHAPATTVETDLEP